MAELFLQEDLAEQSTSSESFVQASSLSAAVTSEDKFVILISGEIRINSTSTSPAQVRVQVDNVDTICLFSHKAEDANDWRPISFTWRRLLTAASHTIDIDYLSSSTSRTVYLRNLRILVWQVTVAAAATTAFPASSAGAPLTAEELYIANTGIYLVLWSAVASSTDAATPVGVRVYQSSQIIGDALVYVGTANASCPTGGFRLLSLAAGSRVVMEVRRPIGTGTASVQYRSLIAIRADTTTDFSPHTSLPEIGSAGTGVALSREVVATTTSTVLSPILTLTYTALAKSYLLLASSHFQHSSASYASIYDVIQHDAVIQGKVSGPDLNARIEPDDVGQVLPFLAFAYSTPTPGAVNDRIRFAVDTGGTTTASMSRLMNLTVGPAITGVAALQLGALAQLLVDSVLDAETLTLSDAIELSRFFNLSDTLSLTDVISVVTQLGETPSEQVKLALADSLLAVLVGAPEVKPHYGPVQLIEVDFESGTRRYSHRDLYVTEATGGWSNTLFKGLQMDVVEIPNRYTDPFYAIQNLEQASFNFGNIAGEFTFLQAEECRGRAIRSWAYDPLIDELNLRFAGIIDSYTLGLTARLDATMQTRALFQRQFPFDLVTTTAFPKAAADVIGLPITECLGDKDALPLLLIEANPTSKLWIYLVARRVKPKPSLGWYETSQLRVRWVYRSGWRLAESEYTVDYASGAYPDYIIVQFTQDQGDDVMTADVEQRNLALRNPVRIVQALLSWYGGEVTDRNSFDTAVARFDTLYPTVIHFDFCAEGVQRNFSEILNDLMFRMRLDKNAAGAWTVSLDEVATTTKLRIGLGDGELENIISLGDLQSSRLDDLPKTFMLHYNFTRTFLADNELYLFHKAFDGVAISNAGTTEFSNPYVREHATADALLQYRAQRLMANDRRLTVTLGMEARNLNLYDLVLVTVPLAAYDLTAEPFEVIEIVRGRETSQVTLARYSPSIYGYVRHTDTDDANPQFDTNPRTPNLSYTQPWPLESLTGPTWVVVQPEADKGDGRVTVTATIGAVVPAKAISEINGTHIIFKYREHEPAIEDSELNALLSMEFAKIPIGAEKWEGTEANRTVEAVVGNLVPGLKYDFTVYLHNSNNAGGMTPNRQDGPVSTIYGQVAPGDETAPAVRSPTDVRLRVNAIEDSRTVAQVSVYLPNDYKIPRDYALTKFYRNPYEKYGVGNSDFGDEFATGLVESRKGFSYEDSNVKRGRTYRYWVRLVDLSGNESLPIGMYGAVVGTVTAETGGTPTDDNGTGCIGASVTVGKVTTPDIEPGATSAAYKAEAFGGVWELSFGYISPVQVTVDASSGTGTQVALINYNCFTHDIPLQTPSLTWGVKITRDGTTIFEADPYTIQASYLQTLSLQYTDTELPAGGAVYRVYLKVGQRTGSATQHRLSVAILRP